LSYTKNAQNGLEIIDETHYYPFGLKHEGYVALQESTNKYKYNGKELQDELGLNMYAMDARMYDPAIARWNVIDPVTHHDASTYGAFNNNPVYWVDPSGRDGEHYDYGSGNYVNGNGDVITQEEALAAYGLDGNGKEKDKKKKASSTKSDTGRRRALRQRDDNRGRLTSGSVLFDARGQELLSHWLNGSGKNLELSNKEWGDYMKANGLLPEQIEEAAMNYLYGFREYIKKEGKIDVDFTFHAEIENGYFTGYEMLHGSNKKVGDTQMKGTVEYNSKTSQFDFNVQIIWNDKIDPNKNYGDDIMMSNLLNVFYSPKDYNVKIKWNDKFSYK
ncbi:RHS repeat-associated core domain-containing protein, partial [Flavobacterium johnsoniae]